MFYESRGMGTKPLVSVVTPFYNTAPYLEECIQSVLGQHYGLFEYILYNNCSTDGSRDIAQRYAARDPRIRLLDAPDFAGQVTNYNRALSHVNAQAGYFKIVQADDALDPECLEKMVAVAQRDPSLAIVGSLYLHGNRVCGTGLSWQTWRVEGRELCRRQLIDRCFFFGSPTVPLFRADLLASRRPFYEEGRYHEDTEAGYEILRTANFGFVHSVLSYLRVDNESIMKSRETFNPMELDRLIIFEQFAKDFLTHAEREQIAPIVHAEYWRCLARVAVRLQMNKSYLQYQCDGLATIGWTIRWHRVALHICDEILDLLLNPKTSAARVLGWLRRRFGVAGHRSARPARNSKASGAT